jgi:hypothetical protein
VYLLKRLLKAYYAHKIIVPENSNLPYGQLQVLTYALDKQNDLTENYLQIPWYVDKSRCDEVESTMDS